MDVVSAAEPQGVRTHCAVVWLRSRHLRHQGQGGTGQGYRKNLKMCLIYPPPKKYTLFLSPNNFYLCLKKRPGRIKETDVAINTWRIVPSCFDICQIFSAKTWNEQNLSVNQCKWQDYVAIDYSLYCNLVSDPPRGCLGGEGFEKHSPKYLRKSIIQFQTDFSNLFQFCESADCVTMTGSI